MAFVSWRMAFQIFALMGLVWVVVFWFWFRDNPRDHKGVNAAEVELLRGNEQNVSGHGDVPWLTLVTRPTMWLLWGQYFCLSYGWYFYVTWPTYLGRTQHGHRSTPSELLATWRVAELTDPHAGRPRPASHFGGFGSRWLPDSNAIEGRPGRWRRTFGFIGFTGVGLLMTV